MANIKSDVNRFRQIVRGRVREELRKHLGHQELIGRQGKQVVSIPIPQLELPRFAHDPDGKGVYLMGVGPTYDHEALGVVAAVAHGARQTTGATLMVL